MLKIQPRSISSGTLESLQERVKRLSDALVASLDPNQKYVDYMNEKNMLERLLRETRGYARSLGAAAHLRHIDCNASGFDDHDQVSSMLLYLVGRFQQWRMSTGAESTRILYKWVLPRWANVNRPAALAFQSGNPLDEPERVSLDIGILTALEHEYQSVVRRLDVIVKCTEDSSCGFAILDRMRPVDDMKDSSKPLGADLQGMGWTVGYIGGKGVLVVCTGYAGRERAEDCRRGTEGLFGVPKAGWLVVGICAGTDHNWPIGTVLVSHGNACSMTDPAPEKYVLQRKFEPMRLADECPDRIAMQQLFRRPPHGLALDVSVADPSQVPVRAVKFACTRDVINVATVREVIRDCLVKEGFVTCHEEFGIEMEGPGVAISGGPMMCIIKGVCDYADERKQQWKKTSAQVFFQLYASETAAELATQLIRSGTRRMQGSHDSRRAPSARPRKVGRPSRSSGRSRG